MTDSADPVPSSRRGRPVTSLLGLLLLPLVIGILVGPHVYNVMYAVGQSESIQREHPGFAAFCREAELEKVTNRCVSISALLLLVPMVRRAGLAREIREALRLGGEAGRDLIRACVLGALSMAALYVSGLALGYYVPPSNNVPGRAFIDNFLPFLAGAVFVGVFEEIFFRGFVFGALRKRLSVAVAMVLSSAFFSMIHFIKPGYEGPVGPVEWHASFGLLRNFFGDFSWAKNWAFAVTLFVMGLALSVLYQRRGHLWYAIGLHGGWVFAMQMGKKMLAVDKSDPSWWFGTSDIIAKGPIAIVVILLFLAWAFTVKRCSPAT